MSVYTHLSDDEFFAFCGLFGVKFKKAIPITQGIKNSNWFIQTDSDVGDEFSYVFTLFEERVPADIIKMATVMHALQDKLPIAPPLVKLTAKGDDIGSDCVMRYENKAILVVPKLSGSHPTATDTAMCRTMGQALATLHETLQTLQPAENYGVPLYDWARVKERETAYMPTDEARLISDIWTAYANLPDDLPKGLCHLDMFTDNTLWDFSGDTARLTGLLDFTEVSVEHYLMDIAITINDFCTTWGNATDGESVNFNTDKMTAFIDGYERVRPLTDNEKTALRVMLAYSATIFWLLRTHVVYYKRLASFHWGRAVRS